MEKHRVGQNLYTMSDFPVDAICWNEPSHPIGGQHQLTLPAFGAILLLSFCGEAAFVTVRNMTRKHVYKQRCPGISH